MKPIISIFLFIFRLGVGVLSFGLAFFICLIAFDIAFLYSFLSGLGAGLITFFGLKWIFARKTIKNSGLSRREYKYIEEHLAEAKGKIGRLQKVMFSVGNIFTIKQNYDVIRVAKKIQSIVENDPKRFYEVESFYYSHLDSLVELTEKYVFLTKQPAKTAQIQESLRDTRITISSLSETVEKDLFSLLSSDVDSLALELDVAKQAIDKNKDNELKS
ncbi:5-bromo-4-chloroindolyl phosphate hydrolysis family protein [Bacillus testis]|uniref:5-bromo-4-chloroindolyl phosphate hydrolysis family protein n=1 Tax=Bacillus testis TaxID=1622072 RepID=UPI00067E77F1|nr:5-bromo-4-chloroindolyl phosphate hydrolysis family protein [Bacillus testis]